MILLERKKELRAIVVFSRCWCSRWRQQWRRSNGSAYEGDCDDKQEMLHFHIAFIVKGDKWNGNDLCGDSLINFQCGVELGKSKQIFFFKLAHGLHNANASRLQF